jgi:hypothetical protein
MSSYQTTEHAAGSRKTWEMLAAHVDPGLRSMYDVGCNEGVFARNLADCGILVFACDVNYEAVVRGLQAKRANQSEGCLIGHLRADQRLLDALPEVDGALLLSVHHQWWSLFGEEAANRMLLTLAGKARKQFFFMPACIAAKYAPNPVPFADNDYPAIQAYFAKVFASRPGWRMRVLGDSPNNLPPSEPLRPLYLIEREDAAAPTAPLVPVGLAALDRPGSLLDVPVARCIDSMGWSFAADGFHYFTATLREALATGQLKVEGSALDRYYAAFRPRDWHQGLGLADGADTGPLRQMPVDIYNAVLPWSGEVQHATMVEGKLDLRQVRIPEADFHRCGPQTPANVRREIERSVACMQKLAAESYAPEIHVDGYIRGVVLRRGDDWRFLVTAGQHRIAALAALDQRTVRVKFQPNWPRLIDAAQVDQWRWVANGLYTREQALTAFAALFARRPAPF